MRPSLLLLLPLLACSSSEPTASSSSPILGGKNDDTHPQVVAIFREAQGASTAEFCSGALIGPNLVLTAAHCGADVVSGGTGIACVDTADRKADRSGPPADPKRYTVVNTGDAYDTSATPHLVTQIFLAPKAGVEPMCGNDVALLVLADAVQGATPYTPRLDGPPAAGDSFTGIGYGYDGASGDGIRRLRDGLAISSVGVFGTRATENDWIAKEGPCGGDSGSPAIDANGKLIGVMSRGSPTVCEDMIYTRVDSFADWLRSHAVDAAKAGGYPTPAWAQSASGDAGPDGSVAASDPTSGCNASAGHTEVGWAMGLVLALMARRRRR